MYHEKELKGKEELQANQHQRTVGTPPIQLASVIGNQAMLQLMGLKKQEKKPNTTGIPDQMKQNFEERSGLSFDYVNVHYNSDKPAQLQALAYTLGNQVYVGPGQEKHLGHELGHVVQQKQGRVRATTNVNGVAVNDDEGLEREADNNQEIISSYNSTTNQLCPVVQAKFTGTYGKIIEYLSVPNGTCKNLIDYFNIQETNIAVEEATCQSCFEPSTNTLMFKGTLLNQFILASKEKDYKIVSSITSDICHELSHAYDYITKKESGTELETIISTELRAWAREAISIMEINKNYSLKYNDAKPELVHGWENVTTDMLDDLENNKQNLIVNRLIQYIEKKVSTPQLWLNAYIDSSDTQRKKYYKEQLNKLKESVLKIK